MALDLLVRGGTVVDGSGGEPFVADVAIDNGKITAVGRVEAECDFHRAEATGGSAEGVITTECVADLTADRAISLTWQMRGNLPY